MFWQFANDITSAEEAKRFYGLFGFIGNFGLIAGGLVIIFCSQHILELDKTASWGQSVKMLSLVASLSVASIILLYYWMTSIKGFKRKTSSQEDVPQKIKKPKLTWREQIMYVATSKHLQYLIIIVIAYFLSMNFCEAIFKDRVLAAFPDNHSYNSFMGRLQIMVGVVSVILTFFGSAFLRFFKWRTGALITPVVLFISSGIFLGVIIFGDKISSFIDINLSLTIVWLGLIQSIMMRATKYSLFDPTREMVYIPLDKELRTKGKACVDLLGGRLGKGGGAWIQSLIFIFTGLGFEALTPAFLLTIWGILIVWFIAIQRLSRIHKD